MQLKKYKDILTKLNEKIWDYAELKFQEYKSSDEMISVLEKEGFHISRGVANLPTSYVATYGNGSPVIGILAEYDALSGLSQEADVFEKKKREGSPCGHGCGHNLLGTAAIGAALKVRDYLNENAKTGTVKIIGCPGEEGGSGKTFMARDGVFDDLDAAITWHPFDVNAVMTGTFLANCQVNFSFKGQSSHAAASPHLGRSALDAVELMNVGVNFLREHIEDSDRIHYAITNTGGISPNVVQANADVVYLIRSENSEKVSKLYDRVVKIAQGAALMTETEVEITFDKACSNVISNSVIEQVLYESFIKIGVPEYTQEEREYAKKFSETITETDISGGLALKFASNPKEIHKKLLSNPICEFIIPHRHREMIIAGSSDVGDVSRIVPTAQIATACFTVGTPVHSWQEVAQGKSSIAVKGMLLAADVMADGVIRLMEDVDILNAAKAEFYETAGEQKYICPIPDDVKPKI